MTINTIEIYEIFKQLSFETPLFNKFSLILLLSTVLIFFGGLFASIFLTEYPVNIFGYYTRNIIDDFISKKSFAIMIVASIVSSFTVHSTIEHFNDKIKLSNREKLKQFEYRLSDEQKMLLNAEMNFFANNNIVNGFKNATRNHELIADFNKFKDFEPLTKESVQERNKYIRYNPSELIFFMKNGGGELLISPLKENIPNSNKKEVKQSSNCLMICPSVD